MQARGVRKLGRVNSPVIAAIADQQLRLWDPCGIRDGLCARRASLHYQVPSPLNCPDSHKDWTTFRGQATRRRKIGK